MRSIRSLARRTRESLFLVPLLIIALCAVAAALALRVDAGGEVGNVPLVLSSTVAGGRSIATTVAGATITVAAIVFSITALSSQIAANQYSPRAVAGFFEDPFQQVVIGLIVGTFTYSLVVLAGLSSTLASNVDPAPSLAVSISVYLGVASAIGIVAYIDHSLRRFQVDSVVRRIARETHNAIKRQARGAPPESADLEYKVPDAKSRGIVAIDTGWVQRLDPGMMLRAMPADSVARIGVRPGEPVSAGDQIIHIWTGLDEIDAVGSRMLDGIQIGKDRSLESDPSFGIRQLVDIALRALSPGVNDPSTAVDVIHQLKIPIREILISDPPLRVFSGDDGRRLYLAEAPTRSDYVHSAFAEIRLSAGDQPAVLRALLEALGDLEDELEAAHLEGRAAAIRDEIEATVDSGTRSTLPPQDLRRALGPHYEDVEAED